MGRAGRLSVESSGDADEHATARGECPVSGVPAVTVGGRKPGACDGWCAVPLDDFCFGPLSLTCNALGQTAVMPGHLVEYNSSIAGEE